MPLPLRSLPLLALSGLLAAAADGIDSGTVQGWKVQLDGDFRLSLLRPDGTPGLDRFGWSMQGGRTGGIAQIASQSLPPGTMISNLAKPGDAPRFACSSDSGGMHWEASLTLSADSVDLAYAFTPGGEINEAWLMMTGRIPGNTGFDRQATAAGSQVLFRTGDGKFGVQYDPQLVKLETHAPYLAGGPRFYLAADQAPTYVRTFAAGRTLHAAIRIVPPSLAQQALPALRLVEQCRLGLATGTTSWLLQPGEELKASVPLTITPARRTRATATWTVSDLHDAVAWRRSEAIDLASCGATLAVTLPAPLRFGPYRLTLTLSRPDPAGQTELIAKDVAVFGVRDPEWAADRIPAEEAFLGASIHGSRDEFVLRQARLLGFRWQRGEFETSFTWNSPEPHQYTFSHDRVRLIRSLGMTMFGQLAYSPWWAVDATPAEIAKMGKSKGPHHPLSARPPRLDDFREYVRTVATFFAGEIRFWEMWNEPHVPIFWVGSPEEYVERLKILAEEVRRADPTAKVLAAGGPMLDPFGRRLLELGAARLADVWTIHWYASEPYLDVEASHQTFRQIHELLAKHGGEKLELWNSEGGNGASTSMFRDAEFAKWPPADIRRPLDHRQQYVLPKLFTIEKAEGVKKHFFYLMKDTDQYAIYLSHEGTGAPRAAMYPIAAWAARLEGATFAERWSRDGLGHAYFFTRPERATPTSSTAVAVLWADLADGHEQSLAVSAADGLRAWDEMGNPLPLTSLRLGVAPAYLEWPGHSVADLQARIAWKRLPKLENPALTAQRNRPADLNLPLISDFPVAREMASAMHPLDLSAACNMGFNDPKAGDGVGGWSDEGPFNDFHGVQPGERTCYGVPFRLIDPAGNGGRAVISLKSDTFPKGVDRVELPVGHGFRGLFVLHASQNYTAAGPAYRLLLTYAGGETRTLEVAIPGQLNDAWFAPDPDLEEKHATKTVPVAVSSRDRLMGAEETKWTRQTGKDIVYRYPRVTWFENPWPAGGAVTSITLVSAVPHGVPIVLAITLAGD